MSFYFTWLSISSKLFSSLYVVEHSVMEYEQSLVTLRFIDELIQLKFDNLLPDQQ